MVLLGGGINAKADILLGVADFGQSLSRGNNHRR